jgi:hypothetical protein
MGSNMVTLEKSQNAALHSGRGFMILLLENYKMIYIPK